MLGSLVKQAMRTRRPMRAQPNCSTSSLSMRSSVMPCSGLLEWSCGVVIVWNDCLPGNGAPAQATKFPARDASFRFAPPLLHLPSLPDTRS